MEVVPDPSSRSVVVPKLTRVVPDPTSTLWLEYQGEGRYRLKSEAVAGGPADGERTTEQGVRIEFDAQDRSVVLAESADRPDCGTSNWPWKPPGWRRTPASTG